MAKGAALPVQLSLDDYYPKTRQGYLFGDKQIAQKKLTEKQMHVVQELRRSISRYNSLTMGELLGTNEFGREDKKACYLRLIEIAVAEIKDFQPGQLSYKGFEYDSPHAKGA